MVSSEIRAEMMPRARHCRHCVCYNLDLMNCFYLAVWMAFLCANEERQFDRRNAFRRPILCAWKHIWLSFWYFWYSVGRRECGQFGFAWPFWLLKLLLRTLPFLWRPLQLLRAPPFFWGPHQPPSGARCEPYEFPWNWCISPGKLKSLASGHFPKSVYGFLWKTAKH